MTSYPVKSSGLHLGGSVFSAGTGREEEEGVQLGIPFGQDSVMLAHRAICIVRASDLQ